MVCLWFVLKVEHIFNVFFLLFYAIFWMKVAGRGNSETVAGGVCYVGPSCSASCSCVRRLLLLLLLLLGKVESASPAPLTLPLNCVC